MHLLEQLTCLWWYVLNHSCTQYTPTEADNLFHDKLSMIHSSAPYVSLTKDNIDKKHVLKITKRHKKIYVIGKSNDANLEILGKQNRFCLLNDQSF